MKYYEINVALGSSHLFATHARSIRSREELEKVFRVFVEKFPAAEGYEFHITKWDQEHDVSGVVVRNVDGVLEEEV